MLGFCGLSNLTKGVQSVPLVRNNPLRQFPVSLSATAALHHPQMVLVRMVPLSNLSNAGSLNQKKLQKAEHIIQTFAKFHLG